jgi:tetratricopeptide (TPR) repeat protein
VDGGWVVGVLVAVGVGVGVGVSGCSSGFWELERVDDMEAHRERFGRRQVLGVVEKLVADDFEESDANLRWRQARALYEVAVLPSTSGAEREAKLREAQRLLKRAGRLDPHNGSIRLWHARVCLALSALGSHAEFVEQHFEAKAQLSSAVALNPDDYEAQHLLGDLAWNVSQWSWAYRAFLAAAVGPAPVESLDGARDHYLRAETIVPRTWLRNVERLAAVHDAMGLPQDAARWAYAAVTECAPKSWDDVDALRQALALLRRLDPAAHTAALATLRHTLGVRADADAYADASEEQLVRLLVARAALKPHYEDLDDDARSKLDQIESEAQTEAEALRAHQQAQKPQGIRDIWNTLRSGADLGPEPEGLRVAGVAEKSSRRA